LEAFNGRGIYSRLLLHTLTSFRQQGVRLARIATQLANRRVQQVWERWGFEFTSSQLTFHLNSR
jgi:ribosomal protein S18 acetylase RimI-like enzyme